MFWIKTRKPRRRSRSYNLGFAGQLLIGLFAFTAVVSCTFLVFVAFAHFWLTYKQQVIIAASDKLAMESRIIELEKQIETHKPISEVLSSEDIEVINKLYNEIKNSNSKTESSAFRTATALVVASKIYDLETSLLAAVAFAESRFNPLAKSSANARGLMQITGLIWKHYGRQALDDAIENADIHDPLMNAIVAAHYLNAIFKVHGDVTKTLRHYNGGPAAISKGTCGNYAKAVVTISEKFEDILYYE